MRSPLASMLLLSFSLLFASSTIAAGYTCPQLPGLWFGTYTYKNADDCRRTGACTHMLSAEVTRLSLSTTYQVDLSPPVDRVSTINITCENGQITLPISTEYKITLTCGQNKMCRVTYEDARIDAVANKIN